MTDNAKRVIEALKTKVEFTEYLAKTGSLREDNLSEIVQQVVNLFTRLAEYSEVGINTPELVTSSTTYFLKQKI